MKKPRSSFVSRFPNLRRGGLATAFAAALLAGRAALAQEEVWIGGNSGLWSNPANWLDASAPAVGGDPALFLRFVQSGITATDDLAGAFALNGLVFDGADSNGIVVAASSGSSLRFTGPNPTIELRGIADATVSAPLQLDATNGGLTIFATGPGRLNLSGAITPGAVSQPLNIDTGAVSPNVSIVQLSGAQTFSGGVVLKSGNLAVASSSALGTGALTVRGGTLSFATSGLVIGNGIVLQGELTLASLGGSGSFQNLTGVISGATPGTGLTLRAGAGTVSLQSASTFTGATTLDYGISPQSATLVGGTLNLGGANGSLLQTSAFHIRAGSTLQLAGNAATDNHVADTTPIHLRSGGLAYILSTSGATQQTETVGPVDGAGYSPITSSTATGYAIRLNLQSLARTERGTFLFRGTGLGGTPGSGGGSIFVNAAPGLFGGGGTGPAMSILPYAIGDTNAAGNGLGFVTYTAGTGIRTLNNSTEYRATIATAAVNENVRLTAAETVAVARTINALLLDGGNVSGAGTLTIASGALLQRSGGGIGSPLNFGNVEANIFTVADLTLSGPVSGTNGLTKSGAGKLTLPAANSFTGPMTINAGTIAFNARVALGGADSAIVINGHGAGLSYTGASPLSFSRPIETRTGLAKLDVTGAGDLAITAPIAGAGGLQITAATGRSVTLPAGSTYAGTTHLGAGRVVIPGDSAFGNGGALNFSGSTLALAGPWNTTREINIVSGTLDTAGFDATWSGVLTGTGSLEKRGAGTLRLTAPSSYRLPISVTGGAFALSDSGVLAGNVSVSGGAEFRLEQSGTVVADRLGDQSVVTLSGGSLVLVGNSSTAITEQIGRIVLGSGGSQTLSLIAPGPAGVALRIGNGFTFNDGDLILRAPQLGGAAGGPFQRITVGNPATLGAGAIPGLFADPALSGAGSSLVVYDTTADAAGTIGLRPLRAEEYRSGPVLQNPANGGTTPATAHFLADTAVGATGASNTIETLTLAPGGNVALAPGQSLAITSGQVLARAGSSAISGGTLSFGNQRANFYTAGEITVGSALTGTAGLKKSGPGTLILARGDGYTGSTLIADGVLRAAGGAPFSIGEVTLAPSGGFDAGAGSVSIGALGGSGVVSLSGGTVTLSGRGTSQVFSGSFSGTGQIVLVDGGNPAMQHTFRGASTFAGNVTLNSGSLLLERADVFGSATLTINGGSLRSSIFALPPIAPTLILNANLSILGSGSLTFGPGTSVSSSSGPWDISLQSTATWNITGALTLPGRLRTQFGPDSEFAPFPGVISVGGAAGAVTAANVRIESGGGLTINDSTAFTGGAQGRLGNTTPVFLGGGKLFYLGNAATNSGETFGALTTAGFSTVTIGPGSTTAATLTAASLGRVDRGTFLFNATGGILGSAAGPNVPQIFSTALPAMVGGNGGTGVNTSIIPWAVGTSGNTASLVTYGPGGVRLLISSDYVPSLAAAAPTNNVQLTGASANTAPRTINSLAIASSLSGDSALTITSGAILFAGFSNTEISIPLNFGAAEAQFFSPLNNGAGLTVTGGISGSGGLTSSGFSALTLRGSNTFSGPITINGGKLSFSTLANLGSGTSAITLHGNSASLTYAGADALTMARGIRVGGGISQLEVTQGAGSATFSGIISGPGGVRLRGPGTITLNALNTYAGPTFIEGNAVVASDAAFGSGAGVFFAGAVSSLKLNGNWATSRRIEIQGQTSINTNGYEAFVTAPILKGASGISQLVKAGAGVLRLASGQSLSDAVSIIGGALQMEQDATHSAFSYTIVTGGALILDNRVLVRNRVVDTASMTLAGGEVRLLGNAGQAVSESVGSLAFGPNSTNTLTVVVPGAFPTQLNFSFYPLDPAGVLFRGDNLGGAAGTAFSRIVFAIAPTMEGGVIPGVLADRSAIGVGSSFATYDSSSDAAGTIGVRPLAASEFTTSTEIRNPVNGGSTPITAHFFSNGPTMAGGASNRIATLRLGSTASVNLEPGQSLSLDGASLLVDAGAQASIAGGTLSFPRDFANLFTLGDLAVASRVAGINFTKTGGGTLTLNPGAHVTGTLNVNEGQLRVASGDALRFGTVSLLAGTSLRVAPLPARIGSINGTGAIDLPAAGTLAVQSLTGAFAISGAGGLKITSHATFTTASTFSGSLAITAENPLPGVTPRVTLSGNGTALNAASVRIDADTVLHLDNSTNSIPRLGIVPLELNGGRFILTGGSSFIDQSMGTLSARGFSTLEVNPTLNTMWLRFNGLSRVDRGTLHVSNTGSNFGTAFLFFPPSVSSSLVGAGTTAFNRPILPFATGVGDSFYGVVPVTVATDNTIRPLDGSQLALTLSTGDNVQIRDAALTNNVAATVNSLTARSDLLGTGTVTVTSGVVIGSGATRIENGLSFGAAEAILSTNQSSLALTGPLNGSGGLTTSGTGTIVLPAVNNIAGTLTINSGALSFSNPAQLGTSTGAIVMHSGGLQWSGAGDLVFPRAIQLNGGIGSVGTTDPAATLHLAQPITGPGGLNIAGRVVFDSAPAYTGPTQISGTLLLGSDAQLGASSQVRFNGGTLTLTGPLTTAREILVPFTGFPSGTLNTGGFDAVLAGPFMGSGLFSKTGSGRMTIHDATGFQGTLTINAGTVAIDGSGASSFTRLGNAMFIVLGGGTLELPWNPSVFTTEQIASLSTSASSSNRIRFTAPGPASHILQTRNLFGDTTSITILSADALGGGPDGPFTRLVAQNTYGTAGGFLSGWVVADAAGSAQGLAVYDATVDAAGPIGLRLARADDYVGGPLLQNPASGGTTPVTANFRVAGRVGVVGTVANVNTLTLTGGATLAIPSGSQLNVNTRAILTSPGAPAAITGGSLVFGSNYRVTFFLGGDLAIDSAMAAPVELTKLGPATLVLAGDGNRGSTSIEEGTVKLGARDPLVRQDVNIAPGGVLDTASRSVTVSALTGSGLVDLGSGGMLTLAASGTFSGSTRGTGTLRVRTAADSGISAVFAPAGSFTHAGPILIERGSLVLEGAGRLIGAASVSAVNGSTISVRNATGLSSATALGLGYGGILDLRPGNAALQLGSLTGYGLGTIAPKHDTESLQVDFAGLSRGPDGGAVFFLDADNASLGAPPGPGVANLRFGPGFSANLVGGPGVTPVIPFMYGATPGGEARLVTYDEARGARLLSDADYSTTPVPGLNFLLTDLLEQDGTITVNTLTATENIEGVGTVNVTGGVALLLNSSIEYGLNFGARQGNLIVSGFGSVHGPITGSAGLTITGTGDSVRLTTSNPFTGPLVINGGIVKFDRAASLGADNGLITVYQSTLAHDGNGAVFLDRPLRLAGGTVVIRGNSDVFHLRGPISGPGGLILDAIDGIALTGANSYTGPTFLRGVITIGGASPFGQTSQIEANSYSLILANSWIESAPFRLNAGLYTINTANFDATLLGSLTSSQSLWTLAKNGSGRLTIANGANFGARLMANAGTLELRGDFTGDITAAAGTIVTGSAVVKNTVVPGNAGMIGTVSIAGALEPGDGVGEFSAGMLILQTNSTLRLLLESGTAYDRVTSRNAPSLGSNITLDLQIAPGFDPQDDFDEFVLIENASTSPLSLSGLSPLVYAGNALVEGEIFSTPGQMWRISYAGGTGNDVTVRAVPEPTAGFSSALGLGLFAARRWRRNGKR